VSGRAETFKSGGRVVKNVTGYDLCKLMAGSWGTLAAMTEVTIKVLPQPETESTVIVRGLDDDVAIRAMAAAMGLPCDVSGAAHLPAAAAKGIALGAGATLTALRLEGVAPSVAHRKAVLQAVMKEHGEVAALDETVSRDLWRTIRDVVPFAAHRSRVDRPLWRISTAPSQGAVLARAIAAGAEAEIIYDWAGGLIWALLGYIDDAGAALVRRAVKACGGHATLIRAPAALRAATDVFEPQDAAMAALTKRVKASFDPKAVLNPGRMWPGS
jgi:glycolate oxidase FAD binding subunit